MSFSKEVIERFWDKVNVPDDWKTYPEKCWEWTAFKDKDGYGKISLTERGKKSYGAHRFSYELYNGPIPDGLLVCHKCDNPSCVNPNHLFLGTFQDNKQDSVGKNRHATGSVNGNSILTEQQVEEMLIKICNNEFLNVNEIAEYYSINRTIVSNILRGKTWKNITNKLSIPLQQIRKMIVQTKYENALNINKVKDIKMRIKNGESNQSIAKIYNVDSHTIYEIKRKNLWSHVTI